MLSEIKDKVKRRVNRFRCDRISEKQNSTFIGFNIGYLTIFHDYEGKYALPHAVGPSLKGIEFLLNSERKYKIKATYNIVGKLIPDHFEIAETIIKDGHDLASHSYDHKIMWDLSYDMVREDISRSRKLFERLGKQLAGFRSPQCKWSFRQMKALLDENLVWSAEADNSEYPYYILQNNRKRLLRLPTTIDDWEYISIGMQPDEMLEKILFKVDVIAQKKIYGAIGFHPWVQGENEKRLHYFDKFLSVISSRKDIEVLTFNEMYEKYNELRKND